MYARAIVAGLLNHPTMLLASAEAISQMPIGDTDLSALRDCLVDAAFDQHDLDSAQLVTICDQAGFGRLTASLINAKSLAFSFTRRQADPETAQRDLGMAIEVLAARPELDAALAAANASYRESVDEAGRVEQQRLIQARQEMDRRLNALAHGDDETV
jgi:DNA primase